MGSTLTGLDTVLAVVPIAVVAAALVLGVRSIVAVTGGLCAIVLLSAWRFPIDREALGEVGPSLVETIVIVVVIIFGGTVLADMLGASGAQLRIAQWVGRAAHERPRAVLMVGLGVAPFAESIIGWGLGVIMSVPLLLRLGTTAREAVAVSLLGIVLGPWGSLAPGIIVMSELGGTDFTQQGLWTAWLTLPVLLIMGVGICAIGLRRRLMLGIVVEAGCAIVVMWAALLLTNAYLGPPLAGVLAAISAFTTLLVLGRLKKGNATGLDRATLRAFSPYIVLCTGLLATALLAKTDPLNPVLQVISGPAFWLVVTVGAAAVLLRGAGLNARRSLSAGLRRALPVVATTVLFVTFGGLLSINGMSAQLASAAAGLGGAFVVVAPWVGLVAGYITGSNSASGAMLAPGFADAAAALGLEAVIVLGVLNVAVSAAVMISPPRVALAVSMTEPEHHVAAGGASAMVARATRTGLIANLVLAASLVGMSIVLLSG